MMMQALMAGGMEAVYDNRHNDHYELPMGVARHGLSA